MNQHIDHRDYQRIASALDYLHRHRAEQPPLSQVAGHVHLSEFHFQRLFSRWAGISPKRFLQFLNKEFLKQQLDQQHSVLEASLETGLSGPGRAHQLLVIGEAMTPAQYQRMGHELTIHYAFSPSPFGDCLLALTDLGICHLAFVEHSHEQSLKALQEEWALATLQEDPARIRPVHARIFAPASGATDTPLPLLLRGSNFQLKVWEALISIPMGQVMHYQQVARHIGQPAATRATASAIARNRIGWLIPCHRVIRKLADSGQYRWGRQRKQLMLAWEASQINQDLPVKSLPRK